ncbi:MAG TPA: hypothetical protein VLA91_12560 [Acidimicrobiia bacterium]|nr:hypothetical protein [Acidimicrobiia bacterium]
MVTTHHISVGLALLGLVVAACSTSCEESLGAYPPDHILVTGAETVAVPHISWTCDDFHADTIDPPPSVPPDAEQRLQVEVTLEAGSKVEIRLGNEDVPVDPAPVEGVNTWAVQIAEPSQPLIVQVCSADQRCAVYWANTYSG